MTILELLLRYPLVTVMSAGVICAVSIAIIRATRTIKEADEMLEWGRFVRAFKDAAP